MPAFTRRYFRDLYARLPQPFVVVFDNYQDIGTDTLVHEVMQYALEEVPEHGNVIVMSRAEPPAQVARLRANGDLKTIDPEHMRLTHDEAKGIVKSRDSMQLSDQCLGSLVEQTRGWAAGLVLFLELRQAGMPERELRDAPLQAVFDYFAGEILRRLDSETRDVLFMTALLPMTTAALAEQLTGRTRTAQILEQLYRNNYFTLRDGQAEPVYQYHPLFREFLLKQAQLAYTPSHLAELKRTAAGLLEQVGQVDAAIELLREAEEWGGMVKAILQCASALVDQGRGVTLLHWLESLPRHVVDNNPWLLYWRGRANLPLSPPLSLPDSERAFEMFRQQNDPVGSWLGQASVWRSGGMARATSAGWTSGSRGWMT